MNQKAEDWNKTGIMRVVDGPVVTEITEFLKEFSDDDGSLATMRLTGHHARRKSPPSDVVYWDDEVPGFGLRLLSSGRKSWIVRYRDRQIRRYETIGCPPEMTITTARRIARQKVAETRLRGLPLPPSRGVPEGETFSEVAEELMVSLSRRWKPVTAKGARNDLRNRFVPFFGDIPIASIARSDVNRWRDSMASRSGSFNSCLPILSALMQEAEVFGYRRSGSNPCRGVARYKRKSKERFLSTAEYRQLAGVLEDAKGEMPVAVPLVWLLIFTGARVGEISGMRWEWVKGERIFLPDSKTGAKVLYLNAPARAVLDRLSAGGRAGLIFTSPRSSARPFNLSPSWTVLRARAGLTDVRIHDLRHSFASVAIRDGISLTMISRLLGHALPETTERYAHLADDAVTEAADRVCGSIAAGLGIAA
jgi:integrase